MSDPALNQHYTVKQVAKLWAVSEDKVRELFRGDPEVLTFGEPETRFKRSYINMRIPETALARVHRKLRNH
jgi:hypothetical protein